MWDLWKNTYFHFFSVFFSEKTYLRIFAVRGANCCSSNLVNDGHVRAFSYQIDFARCHFSLHNCHLLKSFACVLLDKLAWVISFRAASALWKKPKKEAPRGRFLKCDLAPEQRILFSNSAGVSV